MLKRKWKFIRRTAVVVMLLAVPAGGVYLHKALPIGSGYAAKYLCSSVFISKRNPQQVFKEDILPIHFLYKIINAEVQENGARKAAVADALGFFQSKAVFRQGCGCTLVQGVTEDDLQKQTFMQYPSSILNTQTVDRPWPLGKKGPGKNPPAGVDAQKLMWAVDNAFAEPGPEKQRNTRAVIILYDGQMVAERYAPGFHRDMPLLGWSMSKSITSALVGILVEKKMLDPNAPAPVPEWSNHDDPRRRITLDHLMRMSDGLDFSEEYEPFYDATEMLYNSSDFGAYAASRPLAHAPDEKWYYSSGTANIIARIVRQTIEAHEQQYYGFLHREFFDKIDMQSLIMEPDPSGTFVGSSYMSATPRDWARLGLLYFQDGVWQGERILPEGWVAYSTTPTPKAPRGEYGALWWLNAGNPDDTQDRLWPEIPTDAYCARGYQEQYVMVVPSRKLVAVRFGLSAHRDAWNQAAFIAEVLAALPQ